MRANNAQGNISSVSFDRKSANDPGDDGIDRLFPIVHGRIGPDGPPRQVARRTRSVLDDRQRLLELFRRASRGLRLGDPSE
jgi:hypothetical protein